MNDKRERTQLLDIWQLATDQTLAKYLQVRTFQPGENILKQGEQGEYFFILQSGQVEVILEGTPTITITTLSPPDFFGEVSCLTGEVITATIRAVDQVQVQVLSRQGLLRLLDLQPAFMRQILDQLLRRMTKSNERVQEESLKSEVLTQSLASKGWHKYGELLGTSPSMQQLREQLGRYVHSAEPIAILGESGSGKRFVAGHIHYTSKRKGVPYLTESGVTFSIEEWRAKQSAARGGSLLLTEADQLPKEILEQIIKEAYSETRLILVAEELPEGLPIVSIRVPALRERREDIPALVKECLRRLGVVDLEQAISGAAIRKLMLYPFLDRNITELFEVVQRAYILAQETTIYPEHIRFGGSKPKRSRPRVGLALGAGAVRGSAHVGVLKVLEAEGIPIDLIAGCSVGALVGALYAAGKSVQEMEEMLPNITWKQLTSLSWPKIGILNNQRMEAWLTEQIGQLQIEDLGLPFAAVATDAYSGLPVIMQSGSVATVVRASAAIPFLMKPVSYQGKLLWDGSIVHKVPIHLARSMGADVVIAVDVGLPAFKKGTIRNLFDAFMFPLDIMQESVAQDELELADVLLQPVADSSGYSFKNAPLFFKKGEEVTKAAISQIKQAIEAVRGLV